MQLALAAALVMCFATFKAQAQVSAYAFEQQVTTYTPITGGTVYGTTTSDDQRFLDPAVPAGSTATTGPGLPIGFTFVYNGVAYDRIAINNNGWISFGTTAEGVNNASSSSYAPLASTAVITPPHLRNRVTAMGRDLIGGFAFTASGISGTNVLTGASGTAGIMIGGPISGTGIPTGTTVTAVSGNAITLSNTLTANSTNATYTHQVGELRMQTIGTAPNRIAVVQWKNYKRYSTAGNNDNLNFQIRLHETTNLVEIKYGPIVFGTGVHTGTSAVQVGLGGSSATDFNDRQTTTNWNSSTAGTANNVGLDVNTGVVYPVNGLTFIWTPPACNAPGGISFTNITSSGATATWTSTGATSFMYEVRTSGAPGSGATGLVSSGTAATNSVSITGLSANTAYTFHVMAVCGTEQSAWTSSGFTTLCNAIVAPYTETFDAVAVTSSAYVTPPSCWNNFSSSGAYTTTTNVWRFANGTGTPGTDPDYGVEAVSDHTSGSGYFAWYDGSFGTSVTNVTLESPLIDMSALTTPFVRLFVYSNNTNNASLNTLTLQAYNGSAWVTLATHQGNAPSWIELSATVPAGIPATTRFRIVAQPGTGTDIFYNDLLVDDFSVTNAPTCFPPTNISIGNITATSATVTFTTNSSIGYEYEVRTSGAPGSGPAGLVATGNTAGSPFTVSGLTPASDLVIHLRGTCGGTDVSTWTLATSFSTLCDTYDIPWQDDFNNTTIGTIPDCWTVVNVNGATTWNSVSSPTSPAGFSTGVTMRYTYSTSTVADDWLFTPGLELTGGVSYQLNYLLGHNAGTAYTEKVRVMYGTSPTVADMTELIHDHDSLTGTTSAEYEWHFTPPATGIYYIGYQVYSAINQYYVYLDDVSVVLSPVCATTAISVQDDCANNEFSVAINITDLGSAASVDATYTVNYGAPTTVTGITTGTVIGPFADDEVVEITLDNGFPSCAEVDMGSYYSGCPIDVDCGSTEALTVEHCYTNNDPRVFTFIGSDPANTLDLKFLQPSPIAPGDGITIWNGYPGTGTQIPAPITGSDLSSLGTITSSGNIISVSIQSNSAGSCDDGTTSTPWNIQVRCSGCIEPMGDVFITTDCNAYTYNVQVDLWYLGYSEALEQDATSAGISYTVNGGAPVVLSDLTEDIYDLGSFPVGSMINVTLVHQDGEACSNFLGDFIENQPCPPANDACTSPAALAVNNTGACPGAGIGGTTVYADLTGSMPSCSATGTIQDVWYSFNTGAYIMPLTLNLAGGTAGHLGYQIFSACGTPMTTTGACSGNVTGPASISGLAQNTDYLIRIFTRTDLGAAGTFNICISGLHGSQLCDAAINIPSVPVVNQALACQSSNLLSATTVPVACGTASNNYKGGVEALYTFTPSASGAYNISIAGQTWTGIFVYANACPSAGGTCVASIGSSTSSKNISVDLTAGTTYYIWFDTYPSPASPCPGTFSIVQDLCPAPTAVTSTSITTTTASIGWTGAGGNYLIEYGPSASFTTPGTGPLPGTGGTVVAATSNPFTITGLTGNTQYRVFVRRDCSLQGGGYSSNSTGVLFTTAPNPPIQPVCGSTWYDSGGASGQYGNNENYVVTICPPAGQVARVTFTSFNTEASWDRLHIYNGPTTASPMFASPNGAGSGSSPYGAGGWWGDLSSNLPGPFLSTDPSGCLTFAFWSDGSGLRAGWSATIECFTPVVPACIPAPLFPAEGSSACVGATTLLWPASADASGYDVYLDAGATATTLVSSDQPGTSYNAGTLAAGTYTWRIVPRSAAGAATGCPSWSFTRYAIPEASASNNGPACVGGTVQLSTPEVSGATYSWTGPNGFVSSQPSPVLNNVTAADAGTYAVTVSNNGCTSTASTTSVQVQPLPGDVTATASATTVEAGELVDLFATGTAIGTAFVENFNGSLNNWITTNTSTGGSAPAAPAWTLRQSPYVYNTISFSSNDASQFVMTNSDAQGSGSTTITTLQSPAIDLSSYTSASLTFHHYYRRLGTNDTTTVQVSTDGSTWNNVQTYNSTQGAASGFVPSNVDLNTYAGEPVVYIRFRYRATWGYYWAIDNVSVTGQTTAAFSWNSEPAGFTSTEQNPQGVVVNTTTTYTMTASTPQGCTASASVTVEVIDPEDCPGLGNIGEPCDDLDPTTTGDVITADCECVGTPTGTPTQTVVLEVNSDANGQQISWEIAAQGTNFIMCSGSGFPNNATVTVNCDLPEGCYVLRVFDSAGDGIANGGYILRTFPGNERIIDNRNNFTTGNVSAIANDQGFCLPIGDDRLIYTSCDKLDWISNEFIVASLDPLVSAEWINGAPNSLQDANSGYEFWFFDPNGSYSFRILRSHSTSHGYPATGPSRAAHLRLNNWAPAYHIPTGVLMNVRVRGVINGTAQEWGPACRFKIDPVAAQCPVTKLMDIPGNQFLSCNQFRNFAPGQYVHARPVSGATQYQFRFRQPAEGYEVVRTTNSYFVELWWTALPPLETNSQYEVDVRAFKNGQWCPWGEICNLNIGVGPGAQAGGQNALMESESTAATLNMWPNPNRGDQLFISLSAIEENVTTVSVEILDLSGKRMTSRTIATQGGYLNTVIDLQGEIAAGMYLVNIIAGEKIYTKRLVVQP